MLSSALTLLSSIHKRSSGNRYQAVLNIKPVIELGLYIFVFYALGVIYFKVITTHVQTYV